MENVLSQEEVDLLQDLISGHPIEYNLLRKFARMGLIMRDGHGDWMATETGVKLLQDSIKDKM